MSQSGLGIKQYLGPKSWLKIWVLGVLGLAKRLLGADSALAPRSLLARSPQHQGVFCPNHNPVIKLGTFTIGVWSGQKTPWCQDWISTLESFGQITPQILKVHFPEFTFSIKESFSQATVESIINTSFMLIALVQNLIIEYAFELMCQSLQISVLGVWHD